MKLDNMILTDFAAAIISSPNANGEQTTRATVISVDENDDKLVTIRIDGSNEDTAATTTVKCEEDDRVMVLLKGHKATVIGNISSPVLKKVTANDIVAGAVTASAITTQNIESDNENSWINFHLGTFNFGEKLIWDGSDLTVRGTLTAGAGSKIGPWNISNDSIWYGATEAYDTADRLYFGKQGISLGSTFKVSSAGVLNATGATISGTVTAANGNIGGWDISTHNIHSTNSSGNYVYLNDGSGNNQDVLVVRTGAGTTASPYDYPVWIRANGAFKAYNADIKGSITATSGSFGGYTIESTGLRKTNGNLFTYLGAGQVNLGNTNTITGTLTHSQLDFTNMSDASNPKQTIITSNQIMTSGPISEYNTSLSSRYARLGSSNIFAGSQSVNSTGGMISVNYTGRSYHGVGVHTASSGRNGLWSLGYGDASNASESGVWLIFRETDGSVKVTNYIGNQSYPVVSSNDSGQIVAALRTDNATTFSVRGQWGASGTSATWKTITSSASDPKLKKNIKSTAVNALDILRQIKLYSFDWKADNTHWDIGFIAPELYKIDKSLAIPPIDKDSSWGVNDFYLLGVLTKGVQELSARMEELERRLNERGN